MTREGRRPETGICPGLTSSGLTVLPGTLHSPLEASWDLKGVILDSPLIGVLPDESQSPQEKMCWTSDIHPPEREPGASRASFLLMYRCCFPAPYRFMQILNTNAGYNNLRSPVRGSSPLMFALFSCINQGKGNPHQGKP